MSNEPGIQQQTMAADQRGELRILDEVAVFVETFSAPSGEARPASIVISKTLDLSANGLQVVMDTPVQLGSILQLCVQFADDNERYLLVGEVRWVTKTRLDSRFLVGFQLLDSDHSHIEPWKHKISRLMASPQVRVL